MVIVATSQGSTQLISPIQFINKIAFGAWIYYW